jgi:8-oxo-dGTP pyrophosphatase MutT (NUDIX family)
MKRVRSTVLNLREKILIKWCGGSNKPLNLPSPSRGEGKGGGRTLVMSIPKKAVTVILLRGKEPEGFEVFLLKRHEKSSFMGGNFVFPGGRIDRNDVAPEIVPFCKGLTPEESQQILGRLLSPDESFAHWVAGIRELFEEAGVLFAKDQRGDSFRPKDSIERERFLHYRDLLQKGKLTLTQLAQEEKLRFALDQLHYYAHWITPEARPERFDTRFFLARHPSGQEANSDQKETTTGAWLTPKEALERNLKGSIVLSPPTLKTLEDLSRLNNIDEIFHSLKKNEIHPILSILTKMSDESLIILPWDPEYDIFRKGEFPKWINHGRPSQPNDNTTRLLLKEGRWLPYCRIE